MGVRKEGEGGRREKEGEKIRNTGSADGSFLVLHIGHVFTT